MIKVLHTSDWHLGKKLFKIDRTDEFTFFLNWLIDKIIAEKINLLIIAGDIFDVPNPPHESVKLFYNFLSEILKRSDCKIAYISGNHDSGVLIEAPSNLVNNDRIFILGQINQNPQKHIINIQINNTPICLSMLPYFRHQDLIKWAKFYKLIENDQDFFSDEKLIIKLFEKWHSDIEKNVGVKILIAHHLFGNFISSDSEYQLYLSGINSIPVDLFKSVHYMALGHIHKYQKISDEYNAYYTGSPIAFRFSENNFKYVNILHIQNNQLEIIKQKVETLISLIVLKTTQKNWKEDLILLINKQEPNKISYLEVQMEIDSPYSNLFSEIENLLQNTQIKIISFIPIFIDLTEIKKIDINEINNKNLIDHFKDFYSLKYPNEVMEQDLLEEFKKLLNESSQIQIQ